MINVNNGLFLHTHKSADGKTIVHAHPYAKKDATGKPVNHQHTENEVKFIDSLDHTFNHDFTPVKVSVFTHLLVCYFPGSSNHFSAIEAQTPTLRGPPACA